jgi:hypothetical protein
MPREYPLTLPDPMVRAILAGIKTQHRVPIKPQPPLNENFLGSSFSLCRSVADSVKLYFMGQYDSIPKHPNKWDLIGSVGVARDAGFPMKYACPFGEPGARIWVREAFYDRADYAIVAKPSRDRFAYRADKKQSWNLHQAVTMPREASRILLEVVEVRAQRLDRISEEEAVSEGSRMPSDWIRRRMQAAWSERQAFSHIWDSLSYGRSHPWETSPWVWSCTFKRLDKLVMPAREVS